MSSLLLPYGVVTEFDGLQLHLSRNSPTGYTGVTKEGSRFRARRGGQQIGTYETAVEAAAAYAREVNSGRLARECPPAGARNPLLPRRRGPLA